MPIAWWHHSGRLIATFPVEELAKRWRGRLHTSYDLILNASEWKVPFYWEQQRYFPLFQVSDQAAVILNKAAIGRDTET